MAMLLPPALLLLASAATITARAVSIDASSIPDVNTTTSLITSAPTNTTLPDASCKDIDHCRTLVGSVVRAGLGLQAQGLGSA